MFDQMIEFAKRRKNMKNTMVSISLRKIITPEKIYYERGIPTNIVQSSKFITFTNSDMRDNLILDNINGTVQYIFVMEKCCQWFVNKAKYPLICGKRFIYQDQITYGVRFVGTILTGNSNCITIRGTFRTYVFRWLMIRFLKRFIPWARDEYVLPYNLIKCLIC